MAQTPQSKNSATFIRPIFWGTTCIMIKSLLRLRNTFLTECTNGFYFPSTGKCYAKFENAKVNWDTASNECKKIGGVLAVIPNKEMQNFLENNFELSDTIGYWIGGERKGGDWTWTDGSPWTGYANWLAGQPDNVENALLIGPDFTWRDWWKFKRSYYMCQY